ncbi:hypothetical protein MHU86_15395 [Fragilaria crotonensis]|nr:hypothetical protein MHU86_15395 [Fragilaria crotonensis]
MSKSIPTIAKALPARLKLHQTRSLYGLSTFHEPRASRTTSSFSEPSNFVYNGWHHNQHPQHFHSSSVSRSDCMQLPDSRVMSPKSECHHQVTWDEDYDEYNLYISPHQATIRCEQVQHSFESLRHNDLLDLQQQHQYNAQHVGDYSWKTVGSVSDIVPVDDVVEFDDGVGVADS